jgi:hypothetical protein
MVVDERETRTLAGVVELEGDRDDYDRETGTDHL